jgi:hypothetical protein
MYKNNLDGVEITKRFFIAIDVLRANKVIRGLKTFTRKYNINYGNMNTIKNHSKDRILKPEYIAYLCKEYGINSNWILFGEGNIFADKFENNLRIKQKTTTTTN